MLPFIPFSKQAFDTVRAKFWLPESYRDANYKYIFEKFKQKQKETN